MAVSQPISTDKLNNPDHSALHRIIAADVSAPTESISVNAAGNTTLAGKSTGAGFAVANANDHLTCPTVANASPSTADIKVNTTNGVIEWYDGATWQSADCPKHIYIDVAAQAGGNLNLSDVTNWNTSKALIKYITIVTVSIDWDLTLYEADDFTTKPFQVVANQNSNATIYLDYPYQDQDATGEVHIKYTDNVGADTADIYILGVKMR